MSNNIIRQQLSELANALEDLGFEVVEVNTCSTIRHDISMGIDIGPNIWVESPNFRDLVFKASEDQANKDKYVDKLLANNLTERTRLLKLLEEFYCDRKCSIYARLIVDNMAACRSILKFQGAEIMNQDKDGNHHDKWSAEIIKELRDFAVFLRTKDR